MDRQRHREVRKQHDTSSSDPLLKIMSKLAPAVAFVLAICSLSTHAWWDNNWSDDFLGDGWGEFDFGFGMHGRGHGRSYGQDAPYWGYAPYYRPPYYAAPAPAPALTEEQRDALAKQQKAMAEQQQKAFQRAVAAQREFAERLNREMMSPPELPAGISKRIQEHEAKREAMIREHNARFGSAPLPPARKDGLQNPMDEPQARRTELVKPDRDQQQHNPVMTQPDLEM